MNVEDGRRDSRPCSQRCQHCPEDSDKKTNGEHDSRLFLRQSFHDSLDGDLRCVGLEVVDDSGGGEVCVVVSSVPASFDERFHKLTAE